MVLLFGCHTEEVREQPHPALAQAPKAVPEETPQPGDPEVRLLEAGAEPRRPLRFHAPVGMKRSVVMTMRMGMEMDFSGMKLPQTKLPAMKVTMDLTVSEVSPLGEMRYQFVLTKTELVSDPDVQPQVAAAVRDALRGMEGLRGRALVTPRGFTREADIFVPETADPQMRQLLEGTRESLKQMTAPLPAEPVGKGARWETRYDVRQNGMAIRQTATNQLAALEGEHGQLQVKVVQTADRQRIQAPNLPPGATVELVELDSGGGGEVELDFAHLVPPAARLQLLSRSKMLVDAGGQKQPMSMRLDVQMGVESH